jgi:hypothetical protein
VNQAQYQGRFYDGERSKPYKLTFEFYPPITRIQCQYIAAKNNITDPNEIAQIMALEGYHPNRLVKVEEDVGAVTKSKLSENLGNLIERAGFAAEKVEADRRANWAAAERAANRPATPIFEPQSESWQERWAREQYEEAFRQKIQLPKAPPVEVPRWVR